jgi:crossover junction endodeoxyribonuclease RuvC
VSWYTPKSNTKDIILIVLAIDPGSRTAGYALLKKEGRKISYIASGILKFNGSDEFLDRVTDIFEKTQSLIASYKPDCIALESLIFVKSPTALIKLAQSRGVMLAAIGRDFEKKVFEYSPNVVKSVVSGHGHADKEGIQKVLKQYLGLENFKTHDESDAVAIALCHLLSEGRMMMPAEKKTKTRGKGLAASLAHKIKEPQV